GGKRGWGGMLEPLIQWHYVVAVDAARFGGPEVSLRVVPGMEACHWPMRRAPRERWPRIVQMLLTGEQVRARDAVGWLIDAAAPMDDAIRITWELVSGAAKLPRRGLETFALAGVSIDTAGLPAAARPPPDAAPAPTPRRPPPAPPGP